MSYQPSAPMSAPTAPPTPVNAAFWIWVAEAILEVILAIIVMIGVSAAASLLTSDSATAGVIMGTAIGVGIVMIIIAALRILFAVYMRRGRNWARIVLTVLGVLGVLGGISSLVQGSWFYLITVAATIVAIVLMFVPTANPWFRKRA